MSYKIIVPGRPVPKGRPRFNRYTGAVYTPQKTIEYENRVFFTAKQVIKEPLKGSVSVEIKVYTTAKSMDIDNVAKSILDGLNGIAYKDDKQVKKLVVEMFESKNEGVEIEIKKLQVKKHAKEEILND